MIWTVTATAQMAAMNLLTYLTAYLDECGRNGGKPLSVARNLPIDMEDAGIRVKFVIHDRDASFTQAFGDVYMTAGARVIRSAVQALSDWGPWPVRRGV